MALSAVVSAWTCVVMLMVSSPFPVDLFPALLSPTLPAHTFERKGDIQTLIQKLITLELRPNLAKNPGMRTFFITLR